MMKDDDPLKNLLERNHFFVLYISVMVTLVLIALLWELTQ